MGRLAAAQKTTTGGLLMRQVLTVRLIKPLACQKSSGYCGDVCQSNKRS